MNNITRTPKSRFQEKVLAEMDSISISHSNMDSRVSVYFSSPDDKYAYTVNLSYETVKHINSCLPEVADV